jgi:hypothetical protein
MNFKTIKSKPIAALAVVFFLLASMLCASSFVSAAPTGTVHAYKHGTTTSTWSYADGTYTIGTTTFQIDLYIDGASNVWGWGVSTLTWNPAVVRFVTATEGDYLKTGPDDYVYTTMFNKGGADQTNGIINSGIADAILNDEPGVYNPAYPSQGLLCTVTFKIVGVGDANIAFNGVMLNDGANNVQQSITQPLVTVEGQFVAPEYAMGALAALVTAFAAFVAFAAFKKNFKLPAFSKHI